MKVLPVKDIYFPAFGNKENPDNKKRNNRSRRIGDIHRMDNLHSVYATPALLLQSKLIQDGFSPKNIKEWGIYSELRLKKDVDIDVLAENVECLISSGIGGRDIFDRIPKNNEDILAMLRVYRQLKEKFVTPDAIEHQKDILVIQREMDKVFGKKTPDDADTRNLILRILHNTNRNNEHLVTLLLEDENFNNVCLPECLANVKTKTDAQSAEYALSLAQERGYGKEFSWPLSIIISEARPFNMAAVEKMLDEQEFLSDNERFVSDDLTTFLREPNYVLALYMSDDTVKLNSVEELMKVDDEYDEWSS